MRVSRVRATRRRGTAELFAFPEAPASHEQVRAQACQGRKDRSCHKARQTRPSPFPRARGSAAMLERLVIGTGNHALRGAVNWGAEKNRIVTCAELETDKKATHTKPGRPAKYISGACSCINPVVTKDRLYEQLLLVDQGRRSPQMFVYWEMGILPLTELKTIQYGCASANN